MKITGKTKTRDILPLLTPERLESLLESVPECQDRPILSMTVGEFASFISDEESFLSDWLMREKNALKAFGVIKAWRSQMKGLTEFMKKFDIKRSPEEEEAARGVLFPEMGVRMLLTCARFFRLKSLEEAEKVKMSDWLAVFQDESSAALYRARFNKIIDAKHKAKRK